MDQNTIIPYGRHAHYNCHRDDNIISKSLSSCPDTNLDPIANFATGEGTRIDIGTHGDEQRMPPALLVGDNAWGNIVARGAPFFRVVCIRNSQRED
jgi:hypothetical protein